MVQIETKLNVLFILIFQLKMYKQMPLMGSSNEVTRFQSSARVINPTIIFGKSCENT